MKAARLAAVMGAAALLALALIAGGATAAKKKKVVEVANSAVLQGSGDSDGPFPEAAAVSKCPKGKVAFGGWRADVGFGDGAGVSTFRLERTSKREWTAAGANGGESAGSLTALAYCGKTKKLREVRGSVRVAPFGEGTATAACPKKKSVRMGGFSGEFDVSDIDPGIQPTAMSRPSKRTWQVTGINAGEDNAGTLEAIAYCAKGPKLKQVTGTTSVPPMSDLDATATCPKRKPLAFGGFEGEVDLIGFATLVAPHAAFRSSKRSWTATGANFAGGGPIAPTAGNITSYAYCGKKR